MSAEKPVARAKLQFGYSSTRSDRRGQFALDVPNSFEGEALVAYREDYQVTVLEHLHERVVGDQGSAVSVSGVVVVLRGETLTIRGTVVDAQGAAQPGFSVSLLDGTRLSGSSSWAGDTARAMEE